MNATAIAAIGALMALTAWSATSSAAAVVPALIIPLATLVIFTLRVVLSRQPVTSGQAEVAVRIQHHSGPADDGLDPSCRMLLRRAQDAIRAVTSSDVCRAGLLDRAAVTTALAGQESDITATVRDQARVRARRTELTPADPGPMTTAVLDSQARAAHLAQSSTAARVQALERYAAEVARADAAYRDWRQAGRVAELHGQHLDLLARTAADDHGIADIETMYQQARAVTLALREPPL